MENGGDPERETLNVIPAKDGKPYYLDSCGDYWRVLPVYHGCQPATTRWRSRKISMRARWRSETSSGCWQDYPAETLHETIEGFHDTRARFEVFKKAVADDVMGRAASVREGDPVCPGPGGCGGLFQRTAG